MSNYDVYIYIYTCVYIYICIYILCVGMCIYIYIYICTLGAMIYYMYYGLLGAVLPQVALDGNDRGDLYI